MSMWQRLEPIERNLRVWQVGLLVACSLVLAPG